MKEHTASMVFEHASHYNSKEVFKYKKRNSNEYDSLCWSAFANESFNVSRALISLGLTEKENIGIFSENRPEWTISDIGILGIRGVVVPFYATSSKHQLKYIVDETQMRLMFVGSKDQYEKALWLLDNTETLKYIVVYDSGIAPNNYKCFDWETFCSLDENNQHANELSQYLKDSQPDDLATIIYTSGTTGEPKGVMLDHATFFHCFRIHDKRVDVIEKDISACFLPLSHVFERTWTYYILYKGAVNAFIENPRDIVNQLPLIKPTVMCAVPRFFEKTYDGIQLELTKWPTIKKQIFNWAIATGQKRSVYLSKSQKIPAGLKLKYSIADKLVLKKLRNVLGGNIKYMPCAGAAINPSLLRFFHAAGIFVTYGYGATETTATVSCFRSDRYDFDSCGTIMPDVEVKISEEGEILIKGKTVFKGYFNKPDETEKTLVDGWYRSGDKGYITENNDLVMTDRIKDMMKTSVGKYISPQKIELLFTQDPYIEQIIAIGDNRKFVTALIVPSFEMLRKEAERMGIEINSNSELIARKEILDFYNARIAKLQDDFSPYEKVIKYRLLAEPFSIQNGMLTNTLKVRRSKLIELYSKEIDEMYLAG